MSDTKNTQVPSPANAPAPGAAVEAPKTQKRAQPAAPAKPKAPASSPDAPVAAVQPRIKNRHDLEFRHDVFKSDPQKCIRDVGYEYRKPMIVHVDHVHIFHSHNSNGKPQQRTNTACGHWHNVTQEMDSEGNLKAICGPAMEERTITTDSGRSVTKILPVYIEEEVLVGEDAGAIRRHIDEHRHDFHYEGSEDLSPQGIARALKEEQPLAAAMGISLGAGSVQDNTPQPLRASDGVTME